MKPGGKAASVPGRRRLEMTEDVAQYVVTLESHLLASPLLSPPHHTEKEAWFCRTIISSGNRQADRRTKPKRCGQSTWVQRTPLTSSK